MTTLLPSPRSSTSRRRSLIAAALTLLALGLGVLAFVPFGDANAQENRETILLAFKNREGQPVRGLLMDLDSPTGCDVAVADGGPFPSWAGDRRTLRLYNGDLDSGDSLRLRIVHNCIEAPVVQEWWWIDSDGDRIGSKKDVPENPQDTLAVVAIFEEGVATYGLTFTLDAGAVEITLPKDLVAGDQISGHLAYSVTGIGRDRERNRQTLASVAVEVAGTSLQSRRSQWTLQLPEDGSTGIVEITLWDAQGMLLAANAAPLAQEPGQRSDAFLLPRLVKAGEPFRILGPFDGRGTTTEIQVGGATARLMGETPRGLVVEAPSSPLGAVDLRIAENDIVATGDLRNVSILVRASKDTIEVGERLDLSIEVSGLEGLQQPFDVHVLNRTVGLAHFVEAPRSFDLTVSPENVSDDGRYTYPVVIEGSRGGTFDIHAELGGLR